MTSPTIELLAPDHPIKSITVFKSSKAKVVRTFEVEIKAGRTKIHVAKLPSSLDTNYVRFSTSSNDVQVGAVSDVSMSKEYNDSIRELKVRKSALESEKNLREDEADLLASYARTLNGEHIQPERVSAFLDGFVERGRKNLGAVTTLTEEILAIERSIQEETDRSLTRKGDARAHVSLVLACKEPQLVVLNMTYIVSDIQWRPHYELYATTPKPSTSTPTNPPKLPSVTLYYRASIAQRTGEDWSGASLTLSTSSPFPTPSFFVPPQPQWQGHAGVPRLTPVKLSSASAASAPFPAPQITTTHSGGLFGHVPASANANVSTTTTTTGQQQQSTFGQPSIFQSAFGSSNPGGGNGATGTFSAFGNSNTGSAFGSNSAFGSTQPAQASSTFGGTQPQLQPQSRFGAGSPLGQPTTNNVVAPAFGQPAHSSSTLGSGAFGQQPNSSSGGGLPSGSSNAQPSSGSGSGPAFGQPSGFGAFGGGTTTTQQQNAFGSASPAFPFGGAASGASAFGVGTGTANTRQDQPQNAFGSTAPATPFGGSTPGDGVTGTANVHSQQQQQQQQTSQTVPAAINISSSLFEGLFGGAAGTQQQQQGVQSGGLFGTATNARYSNFGGGSLFGHTVQQQQSSVDTLTTTMIKHETSLATSYTVEVGDISSDGVEHQVTIGAIPLEVRLLDRVCVPRLGGQVWLQCQVKNTSEHKLLAGPMTVIADDNYAARICIGDISPGDTFTCLLGDDPDVHLSYTLTSHVAPASNAPQSRFAAMLSKTMFTSKVVLWNKHEWAIKDVVVKEIVPVYQQNSTSLFGPINQEQKVVLRKPEGLADVLEGIEVEVRAEVFHSQEKKQMDLNVKIEESETDYVEVDERGKEPGEKGKKKEKEKQLKRVKVKWEESVNGMGGEKEGRFEWKCDVGAGEKVVLEAQWETSGTPYVRWIEVPA